MKIDPRRYDIEVRDNKGKWSLLDDVISIDYGVSTLRSDYETVNRSVESVEIDCIIDGEIKALAYHTYQVKLSKK